MAEEKVTVEAEIPAEREFEFLVQTESGQDITVRDDQYEFSWLLDGTRRCRSRGKRFRLIDSGRLPSDQMEWMGEAGADIYTADRVKRDVSELMNISGACRSGRSILANFIYGSLPEDSHDGMLSFSDGRRLAGSGAYLHLHNREFEHPLSGLRELAIECSAAGSWLIYYHLGILSADLSELARSGSWIHLSERSLKTDEDARLLLDVLNSARSAGTGVVLHITSPLTINWLWDFLQAGGHLQFRNHHFDFRSPLRAIEDRARRKILDFRAFYLDTVVFP